ncbi:MAG: galactitol-1-phosphate 5-dehydrogenase [Lachnospiraceae bacterium]|nr:galactitol-1-phosphate 5-dehydrogenase [Lachnospiraceae bacterium]
MKAFVLKKIGEFTLEELPEPVLKEGEVLLKVENCGICGSDIQRVYKDGAHNMPLIIGHEFSGRVLDGRGERASSMIGKRVGVFPLIPCMKCPSCRVKSYETCKNYNYLGSRTNGGFGELVAVPEWNLIELPDNVSFEQAAMLEPLSVALHAIERVGEITKDESVAIFGAGTIGQLILAHLLSRGIKNIFLMGNHDIQKAKALEFGLKEENFCDIRKEDPKGFILERTEGLGADLAYEVVGENLTCKQAIDSVSSAGRVTLVGNPHSDMKLERDLYWKILRGQLKLYGTWNSSFKGQKDDWKKAIELLEKGLIHPEKLISHRFPLQKIDRGFQIMRDKSEDFIKIMCEFS